ncbi:hypothetical protein [Alloprevotella sp. oral taxon 473]|uniref:hypothetical protein n=1 Tax=Alloprevotella sp. oral taxon 473 TaxID=712469 RepID=UPI0002A46F7D|nr:hypothetical protein [Alloprevotella sp. oral taxon 473]EKX88699.1 hypothetical protein HMPREF9999_01741 [Alloprevotella sp. oral taxon 473 str. F0040]
MKILLLGDYSNVHATLALGLRALGHKVTLASDGDTWKNYPRDIDLKRPSLGKLPSIVYFLRLLRTFRQFKNYDVVQLINPCFLPLKAERIRPFYHFLRRHNRKVFLGAFGMDHYWVEAGLDCKTFRYSDFNIGNKLRKSVDNEIWIRDWLYGEKGKLNKEIAENSDGIVSGLYEYDAAYRPHFGDKVRFIPFPIRLDNEMAIGNSCSTKIFTSESKVRFFIGIQKHRHAYKGTDVMLRALERLKANYPTEVEYVKAENVPFAKYVQLLASSDVLLDQLYSYTPAMNALQAMAQGLVVVSGGEPENYEILGEPELRPIINVLPSQESVYEQLEWLVLNKGKISTLSLQSRKYIEKHHEYIKVAQRYLEFWTSNMS